VANLTTHAKAYSNHWISVELRKPVDSRKAPQRDPAVELFRSVMLQQVFEGGDLAVRELGTK
jgi:hypothetical protein